MRILKYIQIKGICTNQVTLTTTISSILIVSSAVRRARIKETLSEVLALRSASYIRGQVIRALNTLKRKGSARTTRLRKTRVT